MTSTGTLVAARAAFEERRWIDVLALMAAAEAEAPLGVEDLERWGRAASIQGRDEVSFSMLARCYELSREHTWELDVLEALKKPRR